MQERNKNTGHREFRIPLLVKSMAVGNWFGNEMVISHKTTVKEESIPAIFSSNELTGRAIVDTEF